MRTDPWQIETRQIAEAELTQALSTAFPVRHFCLSCRHFQHDCHKASPFMQVCYH